MSGESEPADTKRARLSNDESLRRPTSPHEVTQLLADWSQGDHTALEKLTPLVHEELRRLAHHYMEGQRPDHTLQTTALVNEAYLRLADQSKPNFTTRSHFFAVAAKAMRQILINHAKAQQRQKRGAGASKVELDEAALIDVFGDVGLGLVECIQRVIAHVEAHAGIQSRAAFLIELMEQIQPLGAARS